jgi:hypothetical protein
MKCSHTVCGKNWHYASLRVAVYFTIQEIQNSQTTTSSNALFHKQESQRQAPANR